MHDTTRSLDIVHAVADIGSESNGLTASVSGLVRGLAHLGHRVELNVLGSTPALGVGAARLVVHPRSAMVPALGLSPSMWRHLRVRPRPAQIVHCHSLWTMPAMAPAWLPQGTATRFVISPRGTLTPWALRRSRWKKRIAWWAAQGRALKGAHCLHATALSEAEDIRRLGLRPPLAIIPNGIDVPALAPRTAARGPRTLLSLGRLHPIKGIDLLLRAWVGPSADHPAWRLVIAGDDATAPGYRRSLEHLARDLGLERVHFIGAVFGAAKSACFQDADAFVLPSHSENFGNVVAEALAHSVPVVAASGTPWEAVEAERCGWWTANDPDALHACLDAVMRLDRPSLAAMGARGRAWMARDFGWPSVARRMTAVYLWLVGREPRPAFVHLQ